MATQEINKTCTIFYIKERQIMKNYKCLENFEVINVHLQQTLYRPRRFLEDETPRFPDSRCMKVVRLSTLRTKHLYLPRNVPALTTVRGGIDLWFIVLQKILIQ
jgi:hypothetical protein